MSVLSLPFRRRNCPYRLSASVHYEEKLFHKFDADVAYHVYAPLTPYLFSSSAPRIAGLHGAVVADYDGAPSDFFKQGIFVAGAYAFRELLGERALKGFDAIHTVNPSGVRLDHPRIYSIPNWVDCSKSPGLLRSKRERQDKFRVLFVGKPVYIKGFDRFIALSKMFDQDDIEFIATFAPVNGDFRSHGKVRLVGQVPGEKIWELYSSGGILLHPTRNETFGLVILESLASGTPVLTTPIPCHSALKLPVQYASTLSDFALNLKEVYDLWKGDYDSYLKLGYQGAEAVRHYDQRILLPCFEAMLKDVAEHRMS